MNILTFWGQCFVEYSAQRNLCKIDKVIKTFLTQQFSILMPDIAESWWIYCANNIHMDIYSWFPAKNSATNKFSSDAKKDLAWSIIRFIHLSFEDTGRDLSVWYCNILRAFNIGYRFNIQQYLKDRHVI